VKQIGSDQIVDNGIPDNTVKPIPRDLADVKATSSGKSGLGIINAGEGTSNKDVPLQGGIVNSSPVSLPETPSLIEIKSQNVKIKEDGTYAVDVIIEVEDVVGVSEYEVRISKGAGSI
jgi:hypothetical protein